MNEIEGGQEAEYIIPADVVVTSGPDGERLFDGLPYDKWLVRWEAEFVLSCDECP